MRRHRWVMLAAAAAVSLALASCGGPASSAEFGKEDLAAIQKQIDDFIAAYNAKDSAKVAGLFTGSGSLMVPNSSVVRGFDTIKGYYDMRFGMGATDLVIDATPTGQGKIGYAVGTYSLRLAPEGGPETRDRGKLLLVMQKLPGNAWRIEILMWSSDLPPPAPPAPEPEKKN